jgi:Arc/MetJ-type ribon-helix-helix transcriptional regulator
LTLNQEASRARSGGVPADCAAEEGGQVILVPMTVRLSPHGQELLEAALVRGVRRSPEEVVERALEELARRSRAVAGMAAFREEWHLTLGPGERVQDLIHEGRKY